MEKPKSQQLSMTPMNMHPNDRSMAGPTLLTT